MVKVPGLTDEQVAIIKDILLQYPSIEFFLYGSRVNGNFSLNSDLDIMAKGSSELPYELLNELRLRFDNSKLPFIVHISDFQKLDKSFLEQIRDSTVKI